MTNTNKSNDGYVLLVAGEDGKWRTLDRTMMTKYNAIRMFRSQYSDTMAGRRWRVVTPKTARQWKAEDPNRILEDRAL